VLGIDDILYGSADPYLWLTDPDPTLNPTPDTASFFSDFKDAKQINFFTFFSYYLLTGTLSLGYGFADPLSWITYPDSGGKLPYLWIWILPGHFVASEKIGSESFCTKKLSFLNYGTSNLWTRTISLIQNFRIWINKIRIYNMVFYFKKSEVNPSS
jgi:hypothetical protein